MNGLRRWRPRGSVGAEARQCPLKLCQSGLDDAERDRAATVDVAVEGTQASRAGILPTSVSYVWESEEDDRKVAGACSEALRRLTAGEGGPVSQRPPQDGLQSLSDGTVNKAWLTWEGGIADTKSAVAEAEFVIPTQLKIRNKRKIINVVRNHYACGCVIITGTL